MADKKDNKQTINEEDLENIGGGYYKKPWGTWIPVDESCPAINSGDECDFPTRKGRYDNCCNCKYFKQ